MTENAFDPQDDVGAVAQPEVLARARRVGPDAEAGSVDAAGTPVAEAAPDLEPWELPPPPPPKPSLRERSVDDVLARVQALTLAQARAFLRAYRETAIASGNAAGGAGPADGAARGAAASLDAIVAERALLREGAIREARSNGADIDTEPLAGQARTAVVEALSHAALRGGGIEEATVAAQVAAQDAAIALTARPWISNWRFEELVEPWVLAWSTDAQEAHPFDILGALAAAFGVMAIATFGLGRTSLTTADLPAILFALAAALLLVLRWRNRRLVQPA